MDQMVFNVQHWLNNTYRSNANYTPIPEDGITGGGTVAALITALQIELHIPSPDGIFGPATMSVCPTLPSSSATKNEVYILQGALYCKGYNPNGLDGGYGNGVMTAIKKFQSDAGLTVQDGITTPMIFQALLNTDAFVLIPGGDSNIRTIQQRLNRDYNNVVGLIPCDGIYSRLTNKALIKALQREQGNTPDGIFGTNTMNACPTIPGTNATKNFILLLQYALYCNHYDPNGFDGLFGTGLKTAIINFQTFACLTPDGYAGPQTWASLLVSTGDPSRKGKACDCSTTITDEIAKTLGSNGYEAVGRYLTGRFKMTVTELETIYGNGIKVFPIFETSGTQSEYFTEYQGKSDAASAALAADSLSFLPGAIIYFAVDFDAIDYEVTNYILPYFKAVSNEFSTNGYCYKVGIYGPRNVCSRIAAAGYSCSSFISDMSSGFSGNLGYPLPADWAFDQISTITIGSGLGQIEIDNNILSNKNNSLYQINANDWTTDAINRGWGPISQEAYYEKINELFLDNIKQNVSEEAERKGKLWNPPISDYLSLGNVFINNETYKYMTDTKIYDTNKPGFMRIYEYDSKGTIHLLEEYKLKPAAALSDRITLGLKNNAKELEFFKKIDKFFIIAGVIAGTYHDMVEMWEKGEVQSLPAMLEALAACIVTNGLSAYFTAILGGVVSQTVAPEVPVVGAIIGGAVGGVVGYWFSNHGSEQMEEFIKDKLAWVFEELFGEVVVY